MENTISFLENNFRTILCLVIALCFIIAFFLLLPKLKDEQTRLGSVLKFTLFTASLVFITILILKAFDNRKYIYAFLENISLKETMLLLLAISVISSLVITIRNRNKN